MRKALTIQLTAVLAAAAVLNGCSKESADTPAAKPKGTEVSAAGQLPITKEKTTLRIMVAAKNGVEDYKTNEFTKWLEEKTNVHIEWEIVQPKEAAEKLNLSLASGTYPDVYMGFAISPTKQMVYGSQGVFLPLNGMIDQYGSGAKWMFDNVEGVKANITAPDGKIYGLPQVDLNPHSLLPQRMWIYQPWLDKLGLKMPTTTDEFYQVLKAFKTQDPNGNGKPDEIPLAGAITGWHMSIDNFLMNSFILNDKESGIDHLMLKDGKIDVAFNKPEWKEGLKYLNKLYSEGLIAPETFTQDVNQMKQMGENPEVPILGAAAGGVPTDFTNIAGKRWNQYVAVPPLKGPNGLQITPYKPYNLGQGQYVVTSAAKDPEVAFRLGDYLLTEEATLRNVNGRQDVEWRFAKDDEKGVDGNKGIWAKIVVPPVPQNVHWGQTGPSIQTAKLRGGLVVKPGELADILFKETKTKYDPYKQPLDTVIPPLFFSEAQASELADLQKSIYDYVKQSVATFTIKNGALNTEWDAYLKQLDNLNLKRFIQLNQEAYDAKYKKK
ncbi:ABC transporter substrate-binding protein [Paenibacillus aurantius]|uniref:ABC transporter substrate-binding protein n=1 Tax=Paenibacillus aurantius TaxID=2918900 RepID=A0AA96LBS0_9BACL|nr:ABC transporter substrate-binding protein [Paenibacillus aurantius]WNQ10208.1 ABC transporter substrate-binding protein [Paenibacillus aurantius]